MLLTFVSLSRRSVETTLWNRGSRGEILVPDLMKNVPAIFQPSCFLFAITFRMFEDVAGRKG